MEAFFEVLLQVVFETVFGIVEETIGGIVENVFSPNLNDFVNRHLTFQSLLSGDVITFDIRNFKGGIS